METFTKAFLISLLMNGSFMTNAMDDPDAQMARVLGMSLGEYHRQVALQQEHFAQQPQNNKEDGELEAAMAASLEEHQHHMAQLQAAEDERLARQFQAQEEVEHLARRLQAEADNERFARKFQEAEEDERLARQFQAKAENEHLARQREEEDASTALIQLLSLQEGHAEHIEKRVDSISSQVRLKTKQYSGGAERPVLEKYMEILGYLKNIPQGSDVHVLDGYVFGPPKMIDTLLEVGRLYNIDDPKLTLAEVGQEMVKFVNDNKGFFDAYHYEGQALTSAGITGILNAHFPRMDAEIVPFTPAAREVWSRAWTLALALHRQDGDMSAIQIIFDQIVEGHLTRGGCIQGRINRGFVGYVSLLAKAGVNLY